MTAPHSTEPDERTLDSTFLADLLRAMERSDEPSWMAVLRFASRHKLRAVLGSALIAEGYPVTPGLTYEVGFWREQDARYAEVVRAVKEACPAVRQMKGHEIGRLYPAGWVRDSSDVDLVAGSTDDLWAAAAVLTGLGWRPDAIALQGAGPDVALNMVAPSPDELMLDHQAIEIVSCEIAGDPWRVPPVSSAPRLRLTGPARQIVAMLEESFERRWVARDLLDASLLLVKVSASGMPALLDEIDAVGLGRAWASLARKLRDLGLVDDELCAISPRMVRRSATQQLRYVARLTARRAAVAATVLQIRQRRRGAALDDRLERTVLAKVPPTAVLASGLPVWGVPAGDQTTHRTAVEFESHRGQCHVLTPVGRFQLHYVKRLGERAVDVGEKSC